MISMKIEFLLSELWILSFVAETFIESFLKKLGAFISNLVLLVLLLATF